MARIDRAAVKAALDQGKGPAKAARDLGISRRQVYHIIEEFNGRNRRA